MVKTTDGFFICLGIYRFIYEWTTLIKFVESSSIRVCFGSDTSHAEKSEF
jgi:hypothetical protein